MNCFLGVPAIAVGLSAISLLAMFPSRSPKYDLGTSTSSVTSFPSPNPVPDSLAKDAAPIPNALEAPELRLLTKKVETHQRHIVYLLCRTIRLYKFPDGNKSNEPNKLNALRFYSKTGRTP